MRNIGWLGRALAVVALSLGGLTPTYAQSVDPALQGRVFQTADGALWVYKDGLRYPVIGLDLSQGQIEAIPPQLDTPIEHLGTLFDGTGMRAVETPAPPPAPAASPTLEVGNPRDNETVPASLHMSGVAYDPLAESGTGVDRVQVFVEDRNAGGVNVGEAALSASVIPNGWDAVVNLPTGPHTLFVYAHSAITGGEAVVSIPVRVAP